MPHLGYSWKPAHQLIDHTKLSANVGLFALT
jgi:hypothetical protein